MSRQKRPGGPYVQPLKQADGLALVDEKGPGKYTLLSGTTYIYLLGGEASLLSAVQFEWDASIIATITIEDANGAMKDVADVSIVAGEWIKEDPSTAYVAIAPAGAGTAVNLTISVPGGTAGGAMVHLGNDGAARLRAKVVVGGTGGVFRTSACAKD